MARCPADDGPGGSRAVRSPQGVLGEVAGADPQETSQGARGDPGRGSGDEAQDVQEFLGWETIHYSVLGYARKQVHPVIAFAPEREDRLRARCKAHKTALRAFLDEIVPEELRTELRLPLRAWTPGWLVPCRADGTCEAPISTGEVPVWAGPSGR